MATFTLTADTNIDALSGKTGGDTYNTTTNYWLTIDQHSRFGFNQSNASDTAATSIGMFGESSKIRIDGRKVRMIPYINGTGNVPTLNTLITQGSASGKLMCVYSTDMAALPKVAGEAMPASGWIQVKQWNDVEYSAGSLTGVSATSTGVSKVGILEIMMDGLTSIYSGTMYNMTLDIKGEWYELGTLDGTNTQIFQVPTHGTNCFLFGVYIETAIGSGVYEPYPNAKYGANLNIGTEEARGKVCWLDRTNGQVRVGSNDGITASGFTPTTGRKIVIPNLMCYSVAAATRRTVSLTNFSVFYTSRGFNIDKCNMGWYVQSSGIFYDALYSNVSFSKTPSMQNSKTSIAENCMLSSSASWYTSSLLQFYNCVFFTSAAGTIFDIQGSDNYKFDSCRFQTSIVVGTAGGQTSGIFLRDSSNAQILNCDFIGTRIVLENSYNVTINNIGYCSTTFGEATNNTNTYLSYKNHAINMSKTAQDISIDGFRLLVPRNSPNGALVDIEAVKCHNVTIKNIGTFDVPLDCVSPYNTAYLVYIITSARSNGVTISNCYATNISAILPNASPTQNESNTLLNTGLSYSLVDFGSTLTMNSVVKGCRASCTISTGQESSSDGVITADFFDSTTSGFIALFSSVQGLSKDKITYVGGLTYVAGQLYANPWLAGQGVEFETGDYILGHTSFKNVAVEMHTSYNSNASQYNYNYAIDLNDSNGYSAMSSSYSYTTLGAAISTHTIDPAKGFKLKLRMTLIADRTYSVNYGLKRVVLRTNSTVDAQKIKYPSPTVVCDIKINADEHFLAGGTGKFAVYLDDMVGFDYPANVSPLMDLYSNPIAGNITSATTTFKFGFSMNRQGIRGQNEDTKVVVVATNARHTQPIITRGVITADGLSVNLEKSGDLAYIGGV